MAELYPKLYKHPNGYLIWARYIQPPTLLPPEPVPGLSTAEIQALALDWATKNLTVNPWRKRLLTDADPGGWYVTVSRDGELFEIGGRLISGAYASMQDAMVAGVAAADALPQLEPLP